MTPDARYAAFAKAEAYMLEHAFADPVVLRGCLGDHLVSSDYSKIYTAYGNQSERYVNWETKADGYYTQAEYAEFAAK